MGDGGWAILRLSMRERAGRAPSGKPRNKGRVTRHRPRWGTTPRDEQQSESDLHPLSRGRIGQQHTLPRVGGVEVDPDGVSRAIRSRRRTGFLWRRTSAPVPGNTAPHVDCAPNLEAVLHTRLDPAVFVPRRYRHHIDADDFALGPRPPLRPM